MSALAEINQYLGESSNTHYTIMKNKHTDEFELFIKDLEKRYHIKTVLVEEYAEIPLLLDKLKERMLDHNVFISGSFEYLSNEEDAFAYSLCKSLGEKLIDSNYNIVTGFGRNVGYYISGVVTQKLINSNIGNIEERLIMRPFAHIMTAEEDTQFRKLLISNANSTIYMFGQCLKNKKQENSRGTIEEYELARNMNKIIIPIGVTGYASREIFNDVKRNIICYPYLEQYIDVLENEKDVKILSSCIVSILNRTIKS